MQRLNQIIIIVGGKGTGKTTFALKLLGKSPKKTLIIDTLDHPAYRQYPAITVDKLKLWKSGTYRIFTGDPVVNMIECNKNVWNANIILEDAFKYLSFNMKKDEIKLFSDSKQHNQDIVIMFHALKQIPSYLATVADKLVIFKTNEQLAARSAKFYNWHDILTAHSRAMHSKNPFYCEVVNL